MIDLTRETPLSLPDAAERLKVTVKTVRVWASRPTNPLETAKLGGKVITSLEALQRFSQQRGDDNGAGATANGPTGPRRPPHIERALADADRKLAALGIT